METTTNNQNSKISLPEFSFFRAPITNVKPYKSITIVEAYYYIRGRYAIAQTDALRALSDIKERRTFKAARFDYCTFSGVFTTRNDNALVRHSGLLCLDFDHLHDVEATAIKLLGDDYFETQLLFRSPSGDGLKWIIEIDVTPEHPHQLYFNAVGRYIKQRYNLEIDRSGKDISRACFLPHDQNVFINTKYF